MKRYFILFSLLLTSLFSTAIAQIKGHSYYAFQTMLSDEIPSAILLEVENDGMLALGMIMYEESKEPIFLYGRRDRQDKNILHMEEHLLNGQWTGKLDLTIENGAIKGGVWKTPQEDRSYEIKVKKTVPFPYDIVRTFFMPATKENMKGHYINYIRQGKAISNDRALNVMPMAENKYGFFSVEQSARTLAMGNFDVTGENNLTFTDYRGEKPINLDIKFFDNFAVVSAPEAEEGSDVSLAEGFYIREPGVLEMTAWSPAGSELFSVRARLEDGVPSLIVSKKRYEMEKEMFMDEPNLKSGRHQLNNVQGRVIDMFIGDIGQDINPHLWLLLEDRTVQMISLMRFRLTGASFVSDPLPNARDIQYFSYSDPNAPEVTSENEEEEDLLDGCTVYGIDSEGKAYDLCPSFDTGDFICHPEKDPIVGEGYLGLGEDWSIHIIVKTKNEEFSYFGQYWHIADQNLESGYKVGYRLTRKRNNLGSGMEEIPCDIEGSFMYIHDSENEWEDIIITPIDGLEFTPKNKKAKYTRVHELG